MYLLDTDHLVIVQQQTQPEWSKIRPRMLQYSKDAFFGSIVSMHEQLTGWQAFLNKRHSLDDIVRGYRRLYDVLLDVSSWQVIAYEQRHARKFKELREKKVRIGTMDLRIAASA